MNEESRVLELERLVTDVRRLGAPVGGWLRAVRAALGLSRRSVGVRLNVSHAAVRDYEAAEARGAISLGTLRRAADAMGCEVVIALVPKQGMSFADLAAREAARSAQRSAPVFGGRNDELEDYLK